MDIKHLKHWLNEVSPVAKSWKIELANDHKFNRGLNESLFLCGMSMAKKP
jgi:hypothetical protein